MAWSTVRAGHACVPIFTEEIPKKVTLPGDEITVDIGENGRYIQPNSLTK
jgi:hypothetical protein